MAGILGTFKMFAFVPISYSLAYVIRGNDTYMYTTCNVVWFFFSGFGRFKNENYTNFLVSLTAVRQFRGNVGPTEVKVIIVFKLKVILLLKLCDN